MRRYGLIGYPLSHSWSLRYFTEKFEREGISDCIYSNYPLPAIGALSSVLSEPALCGLNVTIPYKEQVVPFLDARNEVVEEIGACNCIRIEAGRLTGYNTDVAGFEQSLVRKLEAHHRQALVLGTGGAAKAVGYVLRRLRIGYRLVSRRPRPDTGDLGYDQVDMGLMGEATLIINTTPAGMYPNVDECPPIPYEGLTPRHYLFDLIYNPERTLFLQRGEARGAVVENGHEMLILQAEESWRIWNA
ncbi:MAG TPA: shikimate dehydrogenase [Puia sp.]|jgi:shikimate dehydrogenase|nr:shikimate dehydrogenase [Puia sp.]